MTAGHGTYLVPPSRALWVPADMPHSISLIEDAELRTVYLHSWLGPAWERCEVLEISPPAAPATGSLPPAAPSPPARPSR